MIIMKRVRHLSFFFLRHRLRLRIVLFTPSVLDRTVRRRVDDLQILEQRTEYKARGANERRDVIQTLIKFVCVRLMTFFFFYFACEGQNTKNTRNHEPK